MTAPTMATRVEEYLAYRRALGYLIRIEGDLLRSFARFADGCGHRGPLTLELALRWARLPERADRMYQARRLEMLRPLARYLAPRQPGTEIPPRGLLGPAHVRRPAYIYTQPQIAALLNAAHGLPPADGLRPRTYATLLGLLACTGLRIAEALALRIEDVDLESGVMSIFQTKFRKSRLVPLHPSTLGPLWEYATARCRRPVPRVGASFFSCEAGRPLPYGTVRHTFHLLLQQALPGVRPLGRPRPRLHDLRHTFVCRRLLAWYDAGKPIDGCIDQLSAYLGHVKVTDTYWYLTGLPELFAIAGQRFEHFAAHSPGGTP
jgi:integrase